MAAFPVTVQYFSEHGRSSGAGHQDADRNQQNDEDDGNASEHSFRLLAAAGGTASRRAVSASTVGVLAQQIHLGQATVTGILRRLEERDLIVRNRGDEDRRIDALPQREA